MNWSDDGGLADFIKREVRAREQHSDLGPMIFKLKFETEQYYGEGKTFWPFVELSFIVKPGEHFHVPLLLGPYSYTTYRGS